MRALDERWLRMQIIEVEHGHAYARRIWG